MAYDRSMRVSQSTIDDIKKMGMTKAIEKANSGGASREFVEAARRFYGKNRVTGTAPERNESQRGSRGQGESPKPSGNTVSKPKSSSDSGRRTSSLAEDSRKLVAAAAARRRDQGSQSKDKDSDKGESSRGGRYRSTASYGRNQTNAARAVGDQLSPNNPNSLTNRARNIPNPVEGAASAVAKWATGGDDKPKSDKDKMKSDWHKYNVGGRRGASFDRAYKTFGKEGMQSRINAAKRRLERSKSS